MIDGAWLVLRAVALVLVLQAAGAALFCAIFGDTSLSAESALRRTAWRMSAIALAVLVVQALYEPVHLAGDVSGLSDPALLRLWLGSGAAAALIVRIAGVAWLVCALPWAATRPRLAAAAGVLIAALSFVLTGHTAVAAHRGMLLVLLFAHVLLVMFWFGALWPLRQVLRLEAPARAARTVVAFSTVAVRLVPLLASAGALIAALLLPDVAALRRPWGLLLLGKVLLFTSLMALAALNRLRLTPALAGGEARAATRLSRTIAVEYGLICITLAVTAVMTGDFSPAGE
jgi:putative copper resistance protein D